MSSNRFTVRFHGRESGALGVGRQYRVQVDADSPEHAWQEAITKAVTERVDILPPTMGPLYVAHPTFNHWTYGSGMCGCLFDSGPGVAERLGDAIEAVLAPFDDLDETELEQAKANLRLNLIHYFANPEQAGAQYCEVSGCDCPNPRQHDPEFDS